MAILSIYLVSLAVFILRNQNKSCPQVKECLCNEEKEAKKTESRVIDSVGEANKIFIYGQLKKEEIPQELELGEFWYWIYFEEPRLLVNNASGVPMYIEKMQINPPVALDMYNLDDFVDKNVEIYGYQTWGYAESSVFQAEAIRVY